MRRFYLHRIEDESGVSGTGYVAEGVCFSNGKCALSWTTKYTSIAIYDSITDLENIHSHNGKTIIEWVERVKEGTDGIYDGTYLDTAMSTEQSNSDVSVTENVSTDIKTGQSVEITNPDYYNRDFLGGNDERHNIP